KASFSSARRRASAYRRSAEAGGASAVHGLALPSGVPIASPRLDAPDDVHTMTVPRPRKAHAGPDGTTSARGPEPARSPPAAPAVTTLRMHAARGSSRGPLVQPAPRGA